MAYAKGRTFFDADSHVMELPDFLTQYADPAYRDRVPQIRAVAASASSTSVFCACDSGRHGSTKPLRMYA